MTGRQRVLGTFRFEAVDHPAVDLMEACLWPELLAWFRERHGLGEPDEIIALLNPDCRWAGLDYVGPAASPPADGQSPTLRTATKDVRGGPLAGATTVAEVEAFPRHDPSWLVPRDYAAFARRYPDHGRILSPGWSPLFWGACEAFGLEGALVRIAAEPKLVEAWVQDQHEWYLHFLTRAVRAAQGFCDICWLGDDYAGQTGMLLSPADWRRLIRPRLAEQVRLIRDSGMHVLLHSCGAIRPIIPDLIDIGVSGLLVFQTSAAGMDARSIARDFGGRMVFYGGIDTQGVLSTGSRAEVRAAVRENVEAFRRTGGYVVANAHHGVASIDGGNIVAVFEAARELAS